MNFKMCGGLFSFCFLHETVFFYSDCGKHHTDEHIDEFRITPEKLLVMLKKESVKEIIKENLDKYYL